MSDYTPTTKTVLAYIRGYAVLADATVDEAQAAAVGWLAEVERAAAEKAWDRCVGEMPIDPDWKNFYADNNPYRAEAYRREGKE